MNSSSYARELMVALEAVRTAARICRRVQSQLVAGHTLAKQDRSPVTVADFASQAVVCRQLARAFPDDPVVGEEHTQELRLPSSGGLRQTIAQLLGQELGTTIDQDQALAWIDHGGKRPDQHPLRCWTLDPIDGTKGFLRGDQYAIALALLERGRVVLGVLACPNLPVSPDQALPTSASGQAEQSGQIGVLLSAVMGEGTRQRPLWEADGAASIPVKVKAVRGLARARICESMESGHTDQKASASLSQRLGMIRPPLRMDSQAKYAAVARGQASIYLRLPTSATYRENIWDHAAGMILVQEAGGRVTDLDGQPLDFSRGAKLDVNRGVAATCGSIHDALLASVRQ